MTGNLPGDIYSESEFTYCLESKKEATSYSQIFAFTMSQH